jgi:predicted HicB family RNase H-like nuclease
MLTPAPQAESRSLTFSANFKNRTLEAEFWNTHDTADYLDEFRTVEVTAELRARHFEIEIEEDVVEALQDRAKQQGVSIGHLASNLLREKLHGTA